MDISEAHLHTSDIPIQNLPDSDKKNILALAQVTNPLETGSSVRTIDLTGSSVRTIDPTQHGVPDLPTVMLYTELRKMTCTGKKEHNPNELIQGVLKRKSNYFKCRNIISKILQWHPAHKEKSLSELQELSENKIFEEFQKEANIYVKNFRGSMFYTFQQDGI